MCIHTAFFGVSVSLIYSQVRRERVRAPSRAHRQRETKQGASYARWPLAASAVNKTDHSLIKPETNEKDKIIYSIVGPRSGLPDPGNLYQLPPLSSGIYSA